MDNTPDIYGPNPRDLIFSEEMAWRRLWAILGDKVLKLNPYAVDDETLLACAERGRWQLYPSLTQMVVFHFKDIRQVEGNFRYEAIFMQIGNSEVETHLSTSALADKLTYTANRRQIHVMVNGRPLTNHKMVENLQGKDFFVSHALCTEKPNRKRFPAYRMFKLRGNQANRAAMIRTKMVESKIAMLEEILKFPYSPDYLQCHRDFIDYSTPINAAIAAIRQYPLHIR